MLVSLLALDLRALILISQKVPCHKNNAFIFRNKSEKSKSAAR